MRDNYDFSDAIKNPFAGKKEKGKFNVLIIYDFTDDFTKEENEPTDTEMITGNEAASTIFR